MPAQNGFNLHSGIAKIAESFQRSFTLFYSSRWGSGQSAASCGLRINDLPLIYRVSHLLQHQEDA
jgi:hypothetical protein